jgi:GTPase SAR1 family protein
MKELKTYLPEGTPILIVGNKCDLPNRQINIEDAEK